MRLWSEKRSSVLPSSEGVRFDPARAGRGHVESWFLKANDPRSRRAIWLRWTIWASAHAPHPALAEAWAIAFGSAQGHVATKTTVPFERARFRADSLDACVDGCTLSREAARGRVESGGRAIEYDLAIESLDAPLVLFPAAWMYDRSFPRQKIVSPMPDARFVGTVEVGGESWRVDGWPGMVGHNWGTANSESYAWGHCNAWDGEDDVVFEGFSARVRAGGVLLPTSTLLCLRDRGKSYMLSGFVSLARNRGSMTPRRWRFHGQGGGTSIDGEMWADTEDLVGLFYSNPDGTLCHCLNSKLARAEVTVARAGCAPKTLRSERASLELGTRDPHHGVRMYL